MYKKVFFDATIILDVFDMTRPSAEESQNTYVYLIKNDIQLYTSCDIITTIYYVYSKKDKADVLRKIERVNQILKVIDFSNKEIAQTCKLMRANPNFKDLEDTIQYVLAKKEGCDLIISNDKGFYSEDIPVMSSKVFVVSTIKGIYN